jgi:ribonuclease P protein component
MERRIRLQKPADFERVRGEGRSWAHPLLVLVAHPNDLERSRVGVTASRRVGHAVARNRAKRLLRVATRHLYTVLQPGWDVVLIARRETASAHEPQVQEALRTLMKRAGLLVEESQQ